MLLTFQVIVEILLACSGINSVIVSQNVNGEKMKIVGLLLLLPLLALAAVPSFHEGVKIQADGADIEVSLIAEPFMIDWDGDDLTDLLVGQFFPGKILFYKNIGSNENPEFTFSNYLQADGQDISVSAG